MRNHVHPQVVGALLGGGGVAHRAKYGGNDLLKFRPGVRPLPKQIVFGFFNSALGKVVTDTYGRRFILFVSFRRQTGVRRARIAERL